MDPMTTLLVVQSYIPEYRAPFFEELDTRLRALGVNLVLGLGRDTTERGDAVGTSVATIAMPDRLGRLTGDRLRWRPTPRRGSRPDAVITEFAAKNLETWPMVVTRGPLAVWGHANLGWDTSLLLRRADWFFAYTQPVAEAVTRAGFPAQRVTVVNNSIDTRSLLRHLHELDASDVEEFRARQGLTQGRTALFVGGLDEAKGVDYLLRAAAAAGRLDEDFRWVVAGEGPSAAKVRQARTEGIPVVPVGRMTGRDKALVLASCDVIAMPSAVGLVAVDALAAGRPVVTRENCGHGPEADYLDRVRQSVFVPRQTSPSAFARDLVTLLHDHDRLATMSAACRADATRYGVQEMADRFAAGVRGWLGV